MAEACHAEAVQFERGNRPLFEAVSTTRLKLKMNEISVRWAAFDTADVATNGI